MPNTPWLRPWPRNAYFSIWGGKKKIDEALGQAGCQTNFILILPFREKKILFLKNVTLGFLRSRHHGTMKYTRVLFWEMCIETWVEPRQAQRASALRASQPQNEIDQRHLGGNDRDCPAVWGGYHKAGCESLSCSWLTGVSHISQEPCLLMFMLGSVCPVLYHQRHSLAEPWVSLRQKENQRYHFWLYWKCWFFVHHGFFTLIFILKTLHQISLIFITDSFGDYLFCTLGECLTCLNAGP